MLLINNPSPKYIELASRLSSRWQEMKDVLARKYMLSGLRAHVAAQGLQCKQKIDFREREFDYND